MAMTTITKSIRLSPQESEELSRLSESRVISEAALMKKWIQAGIEAEKLEYAIQAYAQRKTDLRGGAALAGVSYNRFVREVEAHNIVILDDDGDFINRMDWLATAFDSSELREAVQKMIADSERPIEKVQSTHPTA